MGSSLLRKRILVGGAFLAVMLVASGATFAVSTWGEVNRVTIERPVGPTRSEVAPPDKQDGSVEEAPAPEPVNRRDLEVFLLVGSDSREDLEDTEAFGDFEGRRADVVMVFLRTDTNAAVLSLPRDLWIDDVCTGGQSRLNVMLEGCDETMNGATLLTLSVERLIGETVDHFAMVDLAGFQGAVQAVGGYEICLQHAVRDRRADLELPAGCTMATGEQALAWLRSRHTQELTESGWRLMPGVNDLARNERQRAFLVEMMGRLSDFSSPQDMAATARSVAPFVTVDSELTLVDAVDLAWAMRGLGSDAVVQLDVPVLDYVTEHGAAVLLASTPVDEIVAGFIGIETAESPGGVTG